jgi:hypothetical protein
MFLARHEISMVVEGHEDGGHFQQGIGRRVEATGFDVDDNR